MVKERKKPKSWYIIISPPYFGKKWVATTPAHSPELLINRRLTLNLTELIEDVEKYYVKITLRITKVENSLAFTRFDEYEVLRDYISRFVTKGVRRIDVVQDVKTKDEIKLRVKSVAITEKSAKGEIEKNLRKEITKVVKEKASASSLDSFLDLILKDSLKNLVLNETKKIYPLKFFEIRRVQVLSWKSR